MKNLFKNNPEKDLLFLNYNIEGPKSPESSNKKPHSLLRHTEVPKEVIDHFIEAYSKNVKNKPNPNHLTDTITKMWEKGDLNRADMKNAKQMVVIAKKITNHMNELENKKV